MTHSVSDWETVPVASLVSRGVLRVEDGNHGEYRPLPDEFVDDGTPFIRAADLGDAGIDFSAAGKIDATALDRIRKGIGRPLDTLLSHKGTVGKVSMAPADSPDFVCSPQTTFWRSLDHRQLDCRFLRYSLESPHFRSQLSARSSESDMAPYVSLTQQKGLSLVLPSVDVQRAVSDVLGALDDKIAANRKLAATADQLAVSTLASSDVVTLSSLVAHRRSSELPTVSGADLVEHFSLPAFDEGEAPEMVNPVEIKSAKFKVQSPAVLISKLNPRFPRVWEIPVVSKVPAYASTEFLVLEPKFGSTATLWAALRQPSVARQLESMVAGTSGSHQRVKPTDVLGVDVPDVRSLDDSIVETIDGLSDVIHSTRRESQDLVRMRDALLPRLMSGELRVRDAEKSVEAVL